MRLQNFKHNAKLKLISSAVLYRRRLSSKQSETSICMYQVNGYQFAILVLDGLFVLAINWNVNVTRMIVQILWDVIVVSREWDYF
jgi:hypothetical protein